MPEIRLRGGEVDGLALRYTVEGGGPAVLLLHGLGGFAETWRHNIEALSPRATVLALDLPGFGRSAKPRASYRLPFFARVIGAFVDELGLGPVSLVGHSLGGAVAVAYALAHPARVERIALIGALVPGAPHRIAWTQRVGTLPLAGEALAWIVGPALVKAAIARCFHAPMPGEVDFLVDTDYATRAAPEARAAWLATVRSLRAELVGRRVEYARALGALGQPTLLVHGREDPAVPASHCAEAAEMLPRATVRWVERCGHFPHVEHAPVVNGWLADFLAGRPAPR
jgi:4,5:9,10-diseco-3-hydroxy-5,9,17-trioxoandrosta-1(10),2-diene-4-oate hydrolase